MPASQAGRRGFEPRLPLHLFNNLASPICQGLLQNYFTGSADSTSASTASLRLATDARVYKTFWLTAGQYACARLSLVTGVLSVSEGNYPGIVLYARERVFHSLMSPSTPPRVPPCGSSGWFSGCRSFPG